MLPKIPAPGEAAAIQPSSFWDTVITTTPVIMTVLATILAGLSSSEMTRAQYDRAMAAQFQSKAGDQWAFFQAKRMRGTIIEQDLDLYRGRPVRLDAAHLRAALEDVVESLQAAARQALQVRQEWTKTLGDTSAGLSSHSVTSQVLERMPDMGREAQQTFGRVKEVLDREEVSRALAFLGTDHLPHEEAHDRAVTDPAVVTALQALRERKPDADLVPLIHRIDAAQIQAATAVAVDNSKAFENDSTWVDESLRPVDQAVKRLLGLGHGLHQAAAEVEAARADFPTEVKNADGLRGAVDALSRADRAVERRLAVLADYTAGRKDYTARRNNREARYNQQAAGPYELQVLKSSISSDRHRRRSQWFFAAMLGAQAATATASLALAARQKSTLWSLAGLVGLAALGFSVYIYLYF
jgi:hypothetical protein